MTPVSNAALWSRRLAIVGIIVTLFSGGACAAFGIVPLILSYVALGQIKQSGGALGGEEMARTGRILSWVMVGWTILQIIAIAILAIVALAGGFNNRPS
jgi:hypothetical protein